jgi:hypothetical protein
MIGHYVRNPSATSGLGCAISLDPPAAIVPGVAKRPLPFDPPVGTALPRPPRRRTHRYNPHRWPLRSGTVQRRLSVMAAPRRIKRSTLGRMSSPSSCAG